MATFVVTGGATGIGLATVEELLQKGHQVAVVGREEERHRAVADRLARQFPGRVRYYGCDLAARDSVQTLIRRLKTDLPHLNGLINNAGYFPAEPTFSPEGIETTFAVNVLAPYQLSLGLVPLLEKAGNGRIVNVSSVGERYARPDAEDMQSLRAFPDVNRVYNNAKRGLTLLTYALADRLTEKGITVNCLHPGPAATGLIKSVRSLPWLMRVVFSLMKPFRQSPQKAARTSVFLATDPSVATVTGQYFSDGKVDKSSPASRDKAAQNRLLAYCETLCGQKSPA